MIPRPGKPGDVLQCSLRLRTSVIARIFTRSLVVTRILALFQTLSGSSESHPSSAKSHVSDCASSSLRKELRNLIVLQPLNGVLHIPRPDPEARELCSLGESSFEGLQCASMF